LPFLGRHAKLFADNDLSDVIAGAKDFSLYGLLTTQTLSRRSPRVSLINTIKKAGIIRIALALLLFAILAIALYDLFHPNSKPSLGTGAVVFFSAAFVFFMMRARTLPCPRSIKHAIILLFSIGFILRAAVVVLVHNDQVSDFRIFHELAIAITNGKGLAYDGPIGLSEDVALYLHSYGATGPIPTAFRMPGTPLIMAGLYAIAGPNPVAAKLLNAIVGAGIGICLLLLMWTNDPRRAFWAGLIWELYPSSWFTTNLLGTEIHFTFGVVLAAMLLTKTFMRRKSETSSSGNQKFNSKIISENYSLAYALAAGLVMGCTCLIRPSTQLILCMIAVLFLYIWKTKGNHFSWKKPIGLTMVMLLGIAIPLTAWGLRNYRTFGVFEWQSTEMGFNFLTMTQHIISHQEERSLDSLMTVFYRSRDEFEIARHAREIGIRRLCLAAPHTAFIKTAIKNFMRAWKYDKDGLFWCLGFPGYGNDRIYRYGWADPSTALLFQRLVEAGYCALLALALLGAIGTPWREIQNPGIVMMLLYFFGTCLLLFVFQGQSRYHFPIVPFFCVLAAYAPGKRNPKSNDTFFR
jgi:hypothetical protein